MANVIGYEALFIDKDPAGPTASIIDNGAKCAIFFVDPDSKAKVIRYRADQYLSTKTTSSYSPPTATSGIPLRRGKSIVVAGARNINNSRFVTVADTATIHCLYFDQVDVVDLGLAVDQDMLEVTTEIRDSIAAILELLREREREKDNG